MSILDQLEADAKDFLRVAQGEMKWCETWKDESGKEQYEPWYIMSSRYLALINALRKKDALVQSTLSLLEECGMPSNAQEHEWLTEALALTEKLKDHTS